MSVGRLSPELFAAWELVRPGADILPHFPADFDWERFSEILRQHRLLHHAAERLALHQWEGVPSQTADLLRRQAQAGEVLAVKQAAFAVELVVKAAEKGIALMPFKGPVMASYLYGAESLRQSDDLDFLVEPSQLAAARNLLLKEGFVHLSRENERGQAQREWMGYGYTLRHTEQGIVADVDAVWAPAWYRFGLDAFYLFDGSAQQELLGGTVPVPAFEKLALALALHGAKHAWSRLAWLVDLAWLLERVGPEAWSSVLDKAEQQGAKTAFLSGFFLLSNRLGVSLPDVLQEAMSRDRQEPLALISVAALNGEAFSSRTFHLQSFDRFADRLNYIVLPVLLPGTGDWETLGLPRPLFFLYRVFRPLRLLIKSLIR